MSNVWQQVLAVDARFNAYRAQNNPHFRTLYIRRRSQLLRENAKEPRDPAIRKQYLKLRKQLLSQRYGVNPSEGSMKSRSLSVRSSSELTLEMEANDSAKTTPIVPTVEADASRALVGDTTIGENYSFAGVHHVFEQHTGPISRIRFAFDDRSRLGIASMDGTVSICNVEAVAEKSSIFLLLKGHKQGVTDFCWSISNDVLVSCSLDCSLRVWNANSGECVRVVEDACPVLCCCFQPLNNNLVVNIFRYIGGRKEDLTGKRDLPPSLVHVCYVYSTGNQRGSVQVLNISTGKYIKAGTGRTSGAAVSLCCECNGRLFWVGDDKGYVFSFQMDLTSGKLVKGRKFLICQGRPISSLTSRAWISREARDPCLLISIAANMLCLYRVVGNDGAVQFRKKFPVRHSAHPVKSNFCPLMSFRQGACVLSGSEDSCVYLFDIEKEGNPCVNKLQGHAQAVIDVCFNHDESLLASGDFQMASFWGRRFSESRNNREKASFRWTTLRTAALIAAEGERDGL